MSCTPHAEYQNRASPRILRFIRHHYPIVITYPRNLKPVWDKLLVSKPLPPGIIIVGENENFSSPFLETSAQMELYSRAWNMKTPRDLQKAPHHIVLESRFYAPAVPFSRQETSIPLEKLLYDNEDQALSLELLEDISPPRKALAIDERYPGDPGYPLTREVCLALSPPGKTRLPEKLIRWMGEIYSQTREIDSHSVIVTGPIEALPFLQQQLIYHSPDEIWNDTLPVFQNSDLMLGAFMGCITDRRHRILPVPLARCDQRVLPPLRELGFSYLATLSRESLNQGPRAMVDHLNYFSRYGMETSGIDLGTAKTLQPTLFRLQNRNISVQTLFTPQTSREGSLINHYPRDSFLRVPEKDLDKDEYRILFIQGTEMPAGERGKTLLRESLRDKIPYADLIIAQYPGLPGGIEVVEGKPLISNLGTLISGRNESITTNQALILRIGFIQGRPLYWDFFSLVRRPGSVALDPEKKGEALFWKNFSYDR